MTTPWCTPSLIADAFAEIEHFDVRVEKIKIPKTHRSWWVKSDIAFLQGGRDLFLWNAKVILSRSPNVVEVIGEFPENKLVTEDGYKDRKLWPSRDPPFCRIKRSQSGDNPSLEMNFRRGTGNAIQRTTKLVIKSHSFSEFPE